MEKAIIGKKLGMTQVFTDDGRVQPVTVIEAGPCYVTQIKTVEKDGYEAVKLMREHVKSTFRKEVLADIVNYLENMND